MDAAAQTLRRLRADAVPAAALALGRLQSSAAKAWRGGGTLSPSELRLLIAAAVAAALLQLLLLRALASAWQRRRAPPVAPGLPLLGSALALGAHGVSYLRCARARTIAYAPAGRRGVSRG